MTDLRELPQVGYNITRAGSWNYKAARKYNLPKTLPKAVLDSYPALGQNWRTRNGSRRKQVSDAVYQLQKDLGCAAPSCDGMLGRNTLRLIAKAYQPVERYDRHLLYQGVRCDLPGGRNTRLVGLADRNNKHNLHMCGNFGKKRTQPIRRIIIHWGGRDNQHLFDFFAATNKSVSSHGAASAGVAVQFLDLERVAWHAGRGDDGRGWNHDSVGFDCAQFPQHDRIGWYRNRDGDDFDDIQKIRNPEKRAAHGRGLDPLLSLDSRTAEAMREMVFDTLKVVGLEPKAPRGHDGLQSEGGIYHGVLGLKDANKHNITVIGHHHMRRTKPDIIGWWDKVFHGTSLA